MIPYLGLAQRLFMTALLGGAIGTAVAAAWWYVGRERLRELRPRPRLRRLLVMTAAPLIGAVAIVGVVLLPSILHPLGIAADHCAAHPSHHMHLCLIHGAHGSAEPLGWLVIGVAALAFALRARPVLVKQWRANRSLAVLDAAAREEAGGEERMVDVDAPFAAAVGLVAPRVLISRGLRDALSERQLQIVRTHEQVHVRHYHTLLQVLAELTGLLHLPAVRAYLDEEIGLACEQIADREAAKAVDGKLAVAETILAVEKQLGMADTPATGSRPAMGPGIGSSDLERRIEGLLEEPWRSVGRPRLVATAASALIAVGLLVGSDDAIHHALETFLSQLL